MGDDRTPDDISLDTGDALRRERAEDPGLTNDGTCEYEGQFYPEGTVLMIDGWPSTCTLGKWIGEGDDPVTHRHHGPWTDTIPDTNPNDPTEPTPTGGRDTPQA